MRTSSMSADKNAESLTEDPILAIVTASLSVGSCECFSPSTHNRTTPLESRVKVMWRQAPFWMPPVIVNVGEEVLSKYKLLFTTKTPSPFVVYPKTVL